MATPQRPNGVGSILSKDLQGTTSATISASHIPTHVRLNSDNEQLEHLDQEDIDECSKSSATLYNDQERPAKDQTFRWLLTTPEKNGLGFWSWMTSSRTTVEQQRQLEASDERIGSALHQKLLLQRMGSNSTNRTKLYKADRAYQTLTPEMVRALDMTPQDWVILSALTFVAMGVRLFGISWPDEVVLDEAHVGKAVNAYLKNEFVVDPHPPLGKLLLSGICALSNYNGSFAFGNIGDPYPGWVPYVSMRTANAFLGALCAPMAYVTLKASGHGAIASSIAAVLVTFENALTANNRLAVLDAPLMFFTAAAIMSWNLFVKQTAWSFTGKRWMWLFLTGVAMSGAMSVKLAGISGAATISVLSLEHLWSLTQETPGRRLWIKQLAARTGCLLALPLVIYLSLFKVHFSYQMQAPDYERSIQAEVDFYKLQQSLRHSFKPKSNQSSNAETVWRDVVYGSVVQLRSEYNQGVYLHSFYKAIPGGSHQQQVSGYEYPDLNTQWIVVRAVQDELNDGSEEIPARLTYLRNGDFLRLRHVPTRRCLHSHNVRAQRDPKNEKLHEVSAYGGANTDGDSNDWWAIEVVDTTSVAQRPVALTDKQHVIRALETTFRLKHVALGCYLFVDDTNLPRPWGEGRKDIICRKAVSITPKSVWRIVSNEHDHLPLDTPLASYPEPTFLQKVFEMHRLMWSHEGQYRSKYHQTASRPWQWPLARSAIPAWTRYKRQVTIVPNPIVWWTSAGGLVIFICAKVLFKLREKRGYFETGRVREFKQFHLRDASSYFTGWALYYLPYFMVDRTLFIHHYFPALYCSILLTSATFSGLVGFLPRKVRLGVTLSLAALIISVFTRLAPVTYGGQLTREQCESINKWVDRLQGHHGYHLDCSTVPRQTDRSLPLLVLKDRMRKERALWNLQQHQTQHIADGGAQPRPVRPSPSRMKMSSSRASSSSPSPNKPHKETTTPSSRTTTGDQGTLPLLTKPLQPEELEPRTRPPILGMHFPLANQTLPRMDIALMTYQSPPQLWSSDHLRMMLHRYRHNPYQRLQIEQLLKQIKYRDTENHKSGIDKACNLVDSTPYHNGIHDSLGAEEATEEIHTNGRTHPVQYKGRPNYAMQEKMISAAASYASMVEAQRRAEQRPSVFNYILGKGDQFKVSTNTKDQGASRDLTIPEAHDTEDR